jgi:transcriptional regulator with XRE-family HTH domain
VDETIALRTDRLKSLREQRGWSQRELSRLCGLGITTISGYERGEFDVSATHLGIIAKKLGVSTDYLLGLTDDPRGLFDSSELSDDERTIVQAFRRGSWRQVIQVAAERWPE